MAGEKMLWPLLAPGLEEVVTVLREQAEDLVGRGWAEHYRQNSAAPKGKKGYYVPRVRKRKDGSFSAEWIRQRFFEHEGRNRVRYERLRMNKETLSYSLGTLTRAKPWEVTMFNELEPQFVAIRRRLAVLARISKTVKGYDQAYNPNQYADWSAANALKEASGGEDQEDDEQDDES